MNEKSFKTSCIYKYTLQRGGKYYSDDSRNIELFSSLLIFIDNDNQFDYNYAHLVRKTPQPGMWCNISHFKE